MLLSAPGGNIQSPFTLKDDNIMSLQYSISDAVFQKFPDYCRGVVLAHGIRNASSPGELINELRAAEKALASQLTPENVASHPRIESWREAYRSVGIKPGEFRPSMDALARRVVKGDALPAISKIVDLGNLVSIQNLIPIGAHAIDKLTQDIELRFASGDEIFEPFGADVVEHPLPGEIIFVEGNTVLTRRWTWRQSKHTLVVPETTAVEVNVDILPPVTHKEVEQICEKVAALVQKYCGGVVRFEILSSTHPCMLLD
jgi:DNA/RNA-binding domain of Phe-tRNA-synthetase-like protein